MLEHFASQGHEVVVYTAQPSYNDVKQDRQPWREVLGGVDVIRVPLLPERKRWTATRAANAVLFLLRAVCHVCMRSRYNLIIANTFPPILNGVALRLIRRLRNIPYVFHCQDIHPESARLIGKLRAGWAYKMMLRSDTRTCRKAERVVALSGDMLASLKSRGLPDHNMVVINNPPLDSLSGAAAWSPSFQPSSNVFRVLFAGNIGSAQGLDLVIRAAHLIRHEQEIHFVFMGEGSAKSRLVELAGELNNKTVFFEPFQPIETAWAAMRDASIGLVPLYPGLFRYAFPSKSMTYLSAGCPLLAIIEEESELAHTIREHDLGYLVSQRDPAALAAAIHHAWMERDKWTPARRTALKDVGDRLYGRQRMLTAWDRLITHLSPN